VRAADCRASAAHSARSAVQAQPVYCQLQVVTRTSASVPLPLYHGHGLVSPVQARFFQNSEALPLHTVTSHQHSSCRTDSSRESTQTVRPQVRSEDHLRPVPLLQYYYSVGHYSPPYKRKALVLLRSALLILLLTTDYWPFCVPGAVPSNPVLPGAPLGPFKPFSLHRADALHRTANLTQEKKTKRSQDA
jgi:hypothetical protein